MNSSVASMAIVGRCREQARADLLTSCKCDNNNNNNCKAKTSRQQKACMQLASALFQLANRVPIRQNMVTAKNQGRLAELISVHGGLPRPRRSSTAAEASRMWTFGHFTVPSHCFLFLYVICLQLTVLVQPVAPAGSLQGQDQAAPAGASNALAPTIDYSHNMRFLKLPKSTPAGSLIYRLKGSDGDPNSQLSFGVTGPVGRTLLEVLPVPHSWNEADVYLRAKLEHSQYNLSIYVSDGNLSTHVESTILVMPEQLGSLDQELLQDPNNQQQVQQQQQDIQLSEFLASIGQPSALSQQHQLPFLNTKHVFQVPENSQPGETIGQVSVLESQVSQLPVRFELRGKGADKFAIKYVFGPRGQSKADIVLSQKLDFERQNLFNLQVLALNAWTNVRLDTRNVHTMDIVISLQDMQDSPPVFKTAPHALRLANNLQPGDLVDRVEAEDGDFADQRPVHYALDAGSPLASYFTIDKLSGHIRLARPLSDLLSLDQSPVMGQSAFGHVLVVLATEAPDATSYDHLWPPMLTRLELPLLLVDQVNEAPQFLGGWQQVGPTSPPLAALIMAGLPPTNSQLVAEEQDHLQQQTKTLRGFLLETPSDKSPIGQAVQWYANGTALISEAMRKLVEANQGKPLVLDLGLGLNGTFELSLEGRDAHLFQVEPSLPVARQASLTLLVSEKLAQSNWSLFDREHSARAGGSVSFELDILARDFGWPQRMGSRLHCRIDLLDMNDNSPQFESDLYSFSVFESAARGSILGTLKARDPDFGRAGKVRYGPLTGRDSHFFQLHPETGQLSLEGQLDHERDRTYLLLAEARDATNLGHSNYTRLVISVLDVNDNAPVFLQSSYDAVLTADGTFHHPLIVQAVDADEPDTANSQLAYEIVAGNRDELFAIDSVSGQIFPAGQQHQNAVLPRPVVPPSHFQQQQQHGPASGGFSMPPQILEPIKPFEARQPNSQAGKILPGHREVEETTQGWLTAAAMGRVKDGQQQQQQNRTSRVQQQQRELFDVMAKRQQKLEQLQEEAANKQLSSKTNPEEPLISMEQQLQSTSVMLKQPLLSSDQGEQVQLARSLLMQATGTMLNPLRLPPIISLIVRAHDFGIPLRSSTVKVNIYNQALSTRSLSVILNGTSEQLESRREAIERAFGSITGSKASIESIEALSDSSSISVAQVKLSLPQHSLVDLTDLSALNQAIDFHSSHLHNYGPPPPYSYAYPREHEAHPRGQHEQAGGARQADGAGGSWYPSVSSNITSSFANGFFGTDSSGRPEAPIEHRLLIYIIIVAVCILSLLVIWMVYSCSQEDRQTKFLNNAKDTSSIGRHVAEANAVAAAAAATAANTMNGTQTEPKAMGSPVAGGLLKKPQMLDQQSGKQHPSSFLSSYYNGQVWFQPSATGGRSTKHGRHGYDLGPEEARRASSAPSANDSFHSDLHSAIRIRNGRGQFFPNTLGYLNNLGSMESASSRYNPASNRRPQQLGLSNRGKKASARRRVAPMSQDEDFEGSDSAMPQYSSSSKKRKPQIDGAGSEEDGKTAAIDAGTANKSGRSKSHRAGSLSSAGSSAASSGEDGTLILDSDQELLGFDSTGTPIIATLAGRSAGSNLTIGSRVPLVGSSIRGVGPGNTQKFTSKPNTDSKVNKEATSAVPQPPSQPKSIAGPSGASKEQQQADTKERPTEGQSRRTDIMSELSERFNATQQNNKQTDRLDQTGPSSKSVDLGEQSKLPDKPKDSKLGIGLLPTTGSLPSKDDTASITPEPGSSNKLKTFSARKRPLERGVSAISTDSTAPAAVVHTGSIDSTSVGGSRASGDDNQQGVSSELANEMKNGELLNKQSIFAMTYNGLATGKLPD